jgi:uncharacterized protein (DUF2147 family)
MFRNCLIVILLIFAFKANAAAPSPLGMWTEVSGSGMARIAECKKPAGALCAMGLARDRVGQIVETGIVLSDIRPDGRNRWKGTYHHGRQKLAATLSMVDQRQVKMRVCMLVMCQTALYARAK